MAWLYSLIARFSDPEAIARRDHQQATELCRLFNLVIQHAAAKIIHELYDINPDSEDLQNFNPLFHLTGDTRSKGQKLALVLHVYSTRHADIIALIIETLGIGDFTIDVDGNATTFTLHWEGIKHAARAITGAAEQYRDQNLALEEQYTTLHPEDYAFIRSHLPEDMRSFSIESGDMVYYFNSSKQANRMGDIFCNIHSLFRCYIDEPVKRYSDHVVTYELRIVQAGVVELLAILGHTPNAVVEAVENVDYALTHQAYYRGELLISTPFSKICETLGVHEELLLDQEKTTARRDN